MNTIRSITAQLPRDGEKSQWYAFRTMFKREKAVSKRLQAKGMETYIPLRTVVRHYKSKTKTLQIPLFSSYVFVRLTAKLYPLVLEENDVFEIVHFKGEVGRVTDEEINFLKTVLRDDGDEVYDLELHEGFVEGTSIVISGGTLAGTKGKVVEDQTNRFVIVELSGIGMSLRLSVDHKFLAKHGFLPRANHV